MGGSPKEKISYGVQLDKEIPKTIQLKDQEDSASPKCQQTSEHVEQGIQSIQGETNSRETCTEKDLSNKLAIEKEDGTKLVKDLKPSPTLSSELTENSESTNKTTDVES